jgi:hypothetical protein
MRAEICERECTQVWKHEHACGWVPCMTMKVTSRVGQNRIHKPYKTVYLVISLSKIPYIHLIYMVLANRA